MEYEKPIKYRCCICNIEFYSDYEVSIYSICNDCLGNYYSFVEWLKKVCRC